MHARDLVAASRARRSLVARALLVVATTLVVVGSTAGPATAHASLTGSDPAAGSVLATAPERITLEFNEDVAARPAVVVTAPDGSAVDVGAVRPDGASVVADVADADQRGVYTVAYRVVSADGHPVEGELEYTVSAGQVVEQRRPEADDGFLDRHRGHLFWGILAAATAVALILAPLRRRGDTDDA